MRNMVAPKRAVRKRWKCGVQWTRIFGDAQTCGAEADRFVEDNGAEIGV